MISSKISNATRKGVYKRDNWCCVACDSNRGLQVHHIVHRSQGGTNEMSNLVTLCWRCHAVAHDCPPAGTPEYITAEWVEQVIVEYVADHYAQQGIPVEFI